jgi:hypothetical protein
MWIGQAVEGISLPQQDLPSIGHVLVSERRRTHRVQHRGLSFPFGRFILDPDGLAIAEFLLATVLRTPAEGGRGAHCDLLPKHRFQVGRNLLGREVFHSGL